MKHLWTAAAILSFCAIMAIVGGIETGADASMIFWTIPALLIMAASTLRQGRPARKG